MSYYFFYSDNKNDTVGKIVTDSEEKKYKAEKSMRFALSIVQAKNFKKGI